MRFFKVHWRMPEIMRHVPVARVSKKSSDYINVGSVLMQVGRKSSSKAVRSKSEAHQRTAFFNNVRACSWP